MLYLGLDSLLFASEVFVAHPSQAEDHPAILVEVHAVVLVSVQVFEDEVHCPLVVGVLHMTEPSATFRHPDDIRQSFVHVNQLNLAMTARS